MAVLYLENNVESVLIKKDLGNTTYARLCLSVQLMYVLLGIIIPERMP